jgi:hypothetical protein
VYRWVPGWGWGLFSKPAVQQADWVTLNGRVKLVLGRISAPRIGPLAPRRWADQPVETPPFIYRLPFLIAGSRPVSKAEIAEATRLFQRRKATARARKEPEPNLENLTYSEPRNRAGHYAEWPPKYATGICALEMRDACALIRDGRGVWVQRRPEDEWTGADGYSIEQLSDALTLSREDRELLTRILAKSPGRNRGRQPMGDSAMTTAERVAKHRAQKKLQLPATQRALGTVKPPPLGPAVPGTNLIIERNRMLLEKMARQQDEILDRLDQILECLIKDPDRPITREEFQILAVAGTLGARQRPH